MADEQEQLEWEVEIAMRRLGRIMKHTSPAPTWMQRAYKFNREHWPWPKDLQKALPELRELLAAVPPDALPAEDRREVTDGDGRRGRKIRESAAEGGRSRVSKGPSGAQLQSEVAALQKKHPNYTITQARRVVAARNNMPLSTLRDRTEKVSQPA